MDRRIVPAEVKHLTAMAGRLRAEDARELEDTYGENPYFVLGQSYAASVLCWAAVVDGETIAMFGVTPRGPAGQGRPWMIGTKDLDRHRFKFSKGCAAVVQEMLDTFPSLENVVDCRNRKTVRWLKWLGFDFGQVILVGQKNVPCQIFTMEKR